jgi:threonyl-tRNA synthetase
MLILGANEAEKQSVSVRNRDTGETTEMSLDEFIAKIKKETEERISK